MYSTLSFDSSTLVEVHRKLNSEVKYPGDGKIPQRQIKHSNFFGVKSRSRNGCLHCKKMKKRCDQTKPVCSLCNKKGVECVYRVYVDANSRATGKVRVAKPQQAAHVQVPAKPAASALTIPETHQDQAQEPSLDILGYTDLFAGLSPLSLLQKFDDLDDDEELILPMDESLSVENTQTRDGHLDEDGFLRILLEIVTGTGKDKLYWISPDKRAAVQQLRSIYKNGKALLRSPSNSAVSSKLDEVGLLYFDYYKHIVIDSISPRQSDNYFKTFYLPLAEQDESIMYALTAWGGMDLAGRTSYTSQCFMNIAASLIEPRIAAIHRELEKPLRERKISGKDLLVVFSYYMICTSAEVSTGDVSRWIEMMRSVFRMIKKIGLKEFLFEHLREYPKEAAWLTANFFYHDVRHFTTKHTFFTMEVYEDVLAHVGPAGKNTSSMMEYGVDPLNGCNTVLILIEGDIINAYHDHNKEIEELLEKEKSINVFAQLGDQIAKEALEASETKRRTLESSLRAKAESLEAKINEAKPSIDLMSNLDPDVFELHLTSFELLQMTLKLLLNLLLRKTPPLAKEMQSLLHKIMPDIDILLETEMDVMLLFPMMMASLCCHEEYDRILMNSFFTRALSSNKAAMVMFRRCHWIANQYWQANPDGLDAVACYELVKNMKWEICLA